MVVAKGLAVVEGGRNAKTTAAMGEVFKVCAGIFPPVGEGTQKVAQNMVQYKACRLYGKARGTPN